MVSCLKHIGYLQVLTHQRKNIGKLNPFIAMTYLAYNYLSFLSGFVSCWRSVKEMSPAVSQRIKLSGFSVTSYYRNIRKKFLSTKPIIKGVKQHNFGWSIFSTYCGESRFWPRTEKYWTCFTASFQNFSGATMGKPSKHDSQFKPGTCRI
jgi:hypothetical protein